MKKTNLITLLSLILLVPVISYGKPSGNENLLKQTFKVLQFNIWQEGTKVPGGFDGIVDQIIASDADFVTFSEVRNYNNTRFCDRIVKALQDKGKEYYSFYSYDSGILSRYPIIDSTTIYPCVNDHGSIYKAIVKLYGKEIALYTAHLDYLDCAYYDIRGYNGSTWEKQAPLLDVKTILEANNKSRREEAIKTFIAQAAIDKEAGRIIILGGDFNEPSHLDWVESTKNNFDHHGLIIPWPVSTILQKNGYVDAYRQYYPKPSKNPGITFPAEVIGKKTSQVTWTPDSDERERIDFIYYSPFKGLTLTNVCLWGPVNSIAYNKVTKEKGKDVYKIATNAVWPSDHKAVLATFKITD